MLNNKPTTEVFYDGLCHLCSREIEHYKRQKGSEALDFIDITSPAFEARKYGLDPIQVHQVMHVRRSDGSLATRVDAFIEIWSALPRYKAVAKIARWKAIRPFLDLGYFGFAKVRPFLPKKSKLQCSESPYCDIKK